MLNTLTLYPISLAWTGKLFSHCFDIETVGHVFQLHFTNSTSMIEPGFMTETIGDWGKGDIHFGFNVSRVFTIRKSKKSRLIA